MTAFLYFVSWLSFDQYKSTAPGFRWHKIHLRFVDDKVLMQNTCEDLQESVCLMDRAEKDASMNINIAKTKDP